MILSHQNYLAACFVSCFFVSVCSYGEEISQSINIAEPLVSDSDVSSEAAANLTQIVKIVSSAAQSGDDEALRAVISRQYAESGENIKKLLESRKQDTKHFGKRILGDFNFFSVVAVSNLIIYKNVAFVEASVGYKPAFVTNRHKITDGQQQADSVWNSMGGKIFSRNWEKNGAGFGTFYFVRQNDLWRLHCVFLSSTPFSKEELETAKNLMETLAGPNTI